MCFAVSNIYVCKIFIPILVCLQPIVNSAIIMKYVFQIFHGIYSCSYCYHNIDLFVLILFRFKGFLFVCLFLASSLKTVFILFYMALFLLNEILILATLGKKFKEISEYFHFFNVYCNHSDENFFSSLFSATYTIHVISYIVLLQKLEMKRNESKAVH